MKQLEDLQYLMKKNESLRNILIEGRRVTIWPVKIGKREFFTVTYMSDSQVYSYHAHSEEDIRIIKGLILRKRIEHPKIDYFVALYGAYVITI